ncbi:MAG: peptidoglycan DD-metalloendopeptidase family protein [Prevotella sp.]|nr:peptidoglycan DD-metalloendopeptidase family protein [Prevotella sp.]MBP3843828.1 peptidoglycan DD-metalloendopeptidase family protein [Prevotella sp.]
MKKKSSSLALLAVCITANAQFYTVENKHVKQAVSQNVQIENHLENAKVSDSLNLGLNPSEEYFDLPEHKEIAIEYDIPLFVSVRDSMMYELLGRRRNVALPLDFLKVTSDYGYRADPFTKCSRWHSGVDLRAKYAHVYAMFPGVVEKVERKTTGYGNNIIIQHGNLRVRYAHLSFVVVQEGQVVSAGTIIGISGMSGRATAPHLHCEIEERSSQDGAEWRKIDPEPFLAYLNDYIQGLQNKMETLQFERKPQRPLNMTNLFAVMKECGVLYPRIVAAQCVLESGWMTSNLCTRFCNLFGLFDSRKKDYYHFNTWEESVAAYVRLVQSKYNPKQDKDYYAFLKRIGYAENMGDYNAKIRAIAASL